MKHRTINSDSTPELAWVTVLAMGLLFYGASALSAQTPVTQTIRNVSTHSGDSTPQNSRQIFDVEWADIAVDKTDKLAATHLVKVCIGWVLAADRREDPSYAVSHQDSSDKIDQKCVQDNLKSSHITVEAEHLRPGSAYLYQVHLGFLRDAQNPDDGYPVEWIRSEIKAFTSAKQ